MTTSLILVFIYYFTNQERFIFFWDSVNYPIKFKNFGSAFLESPLKAFQLLMHSIRHTDMVFYSNDLPVVPLAPFYLLFGGKRIVFQFSLVLMYLIPSGLFFYLIVKNLSSNRYKEISMPLLLFSFFVFFTNPVIFTPLLWGYPGSACMLIILIIYYIYSKQKFENQTILSLVFMGILLGILPIFRRGYLHFVLSFYLAHVILGLAFLYLKNKYKFYQYIPFIKSTFILGCVSLATILLIGGKLLLRWLTSDYSIILGAWHSQEASIFSFLLTFINYFGLAVFIFTVLGFVLGLFNKEQRFFVLMLVFQIIISFLTMTSMTNIHSQYYYLFVPPVYILLFFLFLSLKKHINYIVIPLAMMTFLCNFSVAFFPKLAPLGKLGFLTSIRHYPAIRNDIEELLRLIRFLEKKKGKLYPIASSTIINPSILAQLAIDHGIDLYIVHSHFHYQISGFPREFFEAEYVLVPDPKQHHLRAHYHGVLDILRELILNKKSLGRNYQKMPQVFQLDGGTKIYLYKKINTVTVSQINFLSNTLKKMYPEEANIFTLPKSEILSIIEKSKRRD